MLSKITTAAFAAMLTLPSPTAWADDYEDGINAFQKEDYTKAMRLLKPLAENGNMKAQFTVGQMYGWGGGVPKDAVEAVRWHRKSAKQGYCVAQAILGEYYLGGKGVPEDYVLGYMWLNISNAVCDLGGEVHIKSAKEKMTPQQIADSQIMARKCFASRYRDCGDSYDSGWFSEWFRQ